MRSILLLALALAAAPLAAKDEVYRWVDAEGIVHYGSKPPSKDAKPVELPPLQTYKSGHSPGLPPAASRIPSSPPAAESLSLRITAPVQDETFRDPQGLVSVSVEVTPALPPGAAFRFYLDGVVQNKQPWAAPGYTFTEVERGEHSVSVAVVAGDGTELRRSPAVRFYQMPPIASPPPPKKGG